MSNNSNPSQSLWSLARTRNGFWVSEKQYAFFKRIAVDGSCYSSISRYFKTDVTSEFFFDDQGVKEIKIKGESKWKRVSGISAEDARKSFDDKKEFTRRWNRIQGLIQKWEAMWAEWNPDAKARSISYKIESKIMDEYMDDTSKMIEELKRFQSKKKMYMESTERRISKFREEFERMKKQTGNF